VRTLNIILPILFAGFFACQPKQDPLPRISAPTLEKGESFFKSNNDSAFYYFNLVAGSTTDSLVIAMAYTYMGIIQSIEGDYYGGQESLLASLTYLDENRQSHHQCLLADYHELGNICLKLKNYDAAIDYFHKALDDIKDPDNRTIVLNGIALTYQKKGDFDQAIALYKSLLAKSTENRKEYARLLSNYARTKWLKDSSYRAGPELQYALKIRKDSNDNRGLNASYAHLADYYSTSMPDSALYYAQKRYEIVRIINNPEEEVETLAKLITLSPPGLLKSYFVRYQYLRDSIQTARNAAKNQFALIRYEAEKNKADKLQLQQDNAQKEIQLVRQQFILILAILLFGSAAIMISLWYRKRQQQLEAASQQTIQQHKLKTSQKVHDVVANGLYRLMMDIQYKPSIDKDQLVDRIDSLYEQSRDISYEQTMTSILPFHEKLAELLTSFASDRTRILIVGNDVTLWEDTDKVVQQEVEHILQELLVNMQKHSQAHSVLLKFERQNGHVQIHYTDDGIGIPSQFKYGNGLLNTENRIKKIGGQHTFAHPGKGLKIHISFPTSQTS
jgi:Signal transduction histidine kinase